ncbi:MAG: PDZ domain-containing protein, partial [Myxococcales bacterium]|nr:PDZ domain-containing protein [Myxococcales bacterium]
RGVLPLTVGTVVPGGLAAAAGVAVGDRLISIHGAALGGMLPMGAATLLGNQPPGATIALGIERAGTAQTISLTLPRR